MSYRPIHLSELSVCPYQESVKLSYSSVVIFTVLDMTWDKTVFTLVMRYNRLYISPYYLLFMVLFAPSFFCYFFLRKHRYNPCNIRVLRKKRKGGLSIGCGIAPSKIELFTASNPRQSTSYIWLSYGQTVEIIQ